MYIVMPYLLVLFLILIFIICVFVLSHILLHCGSFCHENKFLVYVNIPGKKAHSDSDSEWKRSACGTAEALLSLHLVCIVGLTVSHLSLENIP